MSQVVRKFKEAGKIEQSQPELFERSGVGKYNKAELVSGMYRNIDTYIKNNNLSGDRAVSFRNSANQFIKGIENGTITMNGDGTFSDASGSISSTGKFDKNWIGKKKDTTNNAFNLVGDYALDYINQMQQHTEPAPKPKSKFDTNDFAIREISKRWYGGKDIDYGNWFKNRSEQDRNTLLGEVFNNADYDKLFQDYDWEGTGVSSVEDLANRFKGFGTAISNNVLDNDDYNSFAALGGSNLDRFLKAPTEQVEPSKEETKLKTWEAEAEAAGATTPEAKSAYIQRKQREEADKNTAIIKQNEEEIYNRERDKFFNDYSTQNPFRGTVSGYLNNEVTYDPKAVNQHISSTYGDNYGGFTKYINTALNPKYFTGELSIIKDGKNLTAEHLTNNLDLALKSGQLDDLGDGTYGIPQTYNYDNWSFVSYNPVSKQYKETSMLANDAYKKLLAYGEYDKRKKVVKKETGGVVKLQQGGNTREANYLKYRQQFANEEAAKKQEIKAKADNEWFRNEEQVKAGERKPVADDWEYEDWARVVSAGADVGSIIAAFVPGYGTAASAVLGVGSTLGNLSADIADDSVSAWQTVGNAGLGLGMDLVGLIPGLGAAGKGSKILKNLLKVAPKLMTVWSMSTSFAPAIQAFNKLTDKGPKEMTVDDWKALSAGITAAAGGTRWGASAVRNKRLTNRYGTKYRTVTTKSGKQIKVSEDQFQQMKRASGIEGQNAALQEVAKGEELPTTFKKWYNPKRIVQGTPETSKGVDVNTNIQRTRPDGTILEPTRFSNEGIWRSAVDNSWGGDWKGFKGPDWLKNWGYRPVKGNPPTKPATGITSSQRLALPEKVSAPKPPIVTPPPGQYRTVPVGTDKTNHNQLYQQRQPAKPNAEAIVASQTVRPNTPIGDMVAAPKKPAAGAARTARQTKYEEVFGNKVQEQNDAEWNKMFTERRQARKAGESKAKSEKASKAPKRKEEVRAQHEAGVLKQFDALGISPNFRAPIGTEITHTPPSRSESTFNVTQNYLSKVQDQIQKNLQIAKRKSDLPHKPKKTKPKSKKSNKGYVNKKADGGLIQFMQGGKPVGRIKAKDMSGWNRDAALDSYNWLEDFDNWAKDYDDADNVSDAYMTVFNGGEDIYDQLTSKTGDYFKGNYNYSVQDPLAKHRQVTFRGTNKGFDDLIRKSIVGYGTTEGESGYDTFAGDRTGNRTLANLSEKQVTRFNSQLGQRGLELYDRGDGKYRLRRTQIPTVQLPEVAVTAPKSSATPSNPASVLTPAGSKKSGFNLSVMPEDVLALGRMVGGLATNNRAAKLYKEGLKPTLLDTFENTVPLQGNFHAKALAEQQAGNVESMAARPRTSDASLQLAGELEASDRAGQARFQGGLQDADMFYKTRMLGQQESDAAKARRVQVANQNRGSMNAIDAAKKQIDSARVTANYQQVVAPYMAGIENRFRQNTAMKRQFGMEQAQNAMGTEYDANYARIMKQYEKDPVRLNEELTKLRNKASEDMLSYRKQLLGSPWMFGNVPTISDKTPYHAKGSKLTYKEKAMLQSAKDFNRRLSDDNKLMHKDIMEAKREHNKLIANMSALTASLIKRGMNL